MSKEEVDQQIATLKNENEADKKRQREREIEYKREEARMANQMAMMKQITQAYREKIEHDQQMMTHVGSIAVAVIVVMFAFLVWNATKSDARSWEMVAMQRAEAEQRQHDMQTSQEKMTMDMMKTMMQSLQEKTEADLREKIRQLEQLPQHKNDNATWLSGLVPGFILVGGIVLGALGRGLRFN